MKMFSALKPMLYLGFTLGLVPYSLHSRSLFIPAALYSMSLIFLVWQSSSQIISLALNATATDLYRYGYLIPLQMSFNSFLTFTSLIIVLYRHQMWTHLFQELAHLETTTATFDVKTSYTGSLVVQIIGMTFLVIYECVYYVSFFYKMREMTLLAISGQLFAMSVNIVILIEFVTYIVVVRAYFNLVNLQLLSLLEGKINAFDGTELFLRFQMFKENSSHLVKSSRGIHRNLCDIGRQINKTYSLQLLISIGKAIVLITVILYTISLVFLGKVDVSGQSLWAYMMVMILILVENSAELLVLVFVCSSVSDQANYTSVLVHKLMNTELLPNTREELQLFSYQLLHQKVYFSVCGFFNLDFTLLNGVIASVATYLVILIQFQM